MTTGAKTVTILFTDLVGSTELLVRVRDAAQEMGMAKVQADAEGLLAEASA